MTELPVQGRLIVLEGPDGVGKSTLAEHFTSRLHEAGVPCEYLAFPGRQLGSLGRLVYDLHHNAPGYGLGEVNPTSLQVLHIAAHIEAIEVHILPALRRGIWVVLDRYWWSTWVYGADFGVSERSLEVMIELEKLHWGSVKPDLLILVERDDETEDDSEKLHAQILKGYRELASKEQQCLRVAILNNESTLEDALNEMWDLVDPISLQHMQMDDYTEFSRPSDQLEVHEDAVLRPPRMSGLSPAKPTIVYDSYWSFAAKRQEVFFRRFEGCPPPWTTDPVIARHKFTNAYRAADRVSQYLIGHVIYEGDQSVEEVFFRTILFKLFNKIETWELLKSKLGEITWEGYSFDRLDSVLTSALASKIPIYSGAYIMPSGDKSFGYRKKHRNHLALLERMMEDGLPYRVSDTATMQEAFEALRSYPMLGDFLAYQFVTDLNYSEICHFSEMEFVVPGPGARDGIHKCFDDLGGLSETDIIRLVTDRQEYEFEQLGLEFRSLWGRPLQLIDCQNLFCEVSKYARVVHPDVKGINARFRIKQIYRPSGKRLEFWFPPKWKINHLVTPVRV